MFLEVLEQILNARKGLLFEASVKAHGREEAFEICQKAQKQKNPNSEIGSFCDIVGFMETALFSAEIHELHKILHWIRIRLEKSGMQGKEVRRIELAAEEAVVNVILHGYEGKKGRLEVGFKKGPGRIELLFRDWGPPFDPLSNAPEVDPAAPLEQREAGGLGIFFMRQIMDEIVYQRENNANVLSMLKNL